MLEYNNIEYETFGNGFTVFFQGDEIYFDTEEEVKDFINENF